MCFGPTPPECHLRWCRELQIREEFSWHFEGEDIGPYVNCVSFALPSCCRYQRGHEDDCGQESAPGLKPGALRFLHLLQLGLFPLPAHQLSPWKWRGGYPSGNSLPALSCGSTAGWHSCMLCLAELLPPGWCCAAVNHSCECKPLSPNPAPGLLATRPPWKKKH